MRFQFVFRYKAEPGTRGSPHWMTCDVRVKQKELEFCWFDPYDFPETFLAALATTREKCPTAKLGLSTLNIQTDSDNCGYFAIRLAKILSESPDFHDHFFSLPD